MAAPIELSLILPVYNEEACIEATLGEARQALQALGRPFEILAVNDGSTDGTPAILTRLAAEWPELRLFTIVPNSGQSVAMGAGFREARGEVIALMDADGQNDPSDIPLLLEGLGEFDVCCGIRANRQDTWSKRTGSRMANRLRSRILGDNITDTGCTLKVFKSWVLKDLAIWHGMHRFLPALAIMKGARLTERPVNHRARSAGTSKYTNFGRLKETIWDLWAVRWMQKRHRRFEVREGV